MRQIKVLGTGCPKCRKLAENAQSAAKDLGIDYELEKVTEINEIVNFGVMMTPALAVDGKVVLSGTAGTVDEIRNLLSKEDA